MGSEAKLDLATSFERRAEPQPNLMKIPPRGDADSGVKLGVQSTCDKRIFTAGKGCDKHLRRQKTSHSEKVPIAAFSYVGFYEDGRRTVSGDGSEHVGHPDVPNLRRLLCLTGGRPALANHLQVENEQGGTSGS